MDNRFPFQQVVITSGGSWDANSLRTIEDFKSSPLHLHPPEVWKTWENSSEARREQWKTAAEKVKGSMNADEDALTFFGATFELTDRLINDREVKGVAGVYFNPMGGEHSEQHEGIEHYNDAAYAAKRLSELGYNVMVLDVDGHHSVETESILRNERVMTVSVHASETSATPVSDPDKGYFNYPLGAEARSLEFFDYLTQIEVASHKFFDNEGLDVILLVVGSDCLDTSSLPLYWTPETYAVLGDRVGKLSALSGASVLVLGGGSTGIDKNPSTWCNLLLGLEAAQHLGALVQSQTGLTH